jgi:receptor protein-tyrosine kinase
MGIVERAADILDEFSDSELRPPVIGRKDEARHLDLIERAAADGAPAPSGPHVHVAPLAEEPPAPGGAARSRRVSVQLQRLRAEQVMTPADDRSSVTENFRRVKRHVISNIDRRKSLEGGTQNLVMVTSALPGEGKTYCAVNLAISIAMEVDRTVLLVDGDVAKPSVTSLLGVQTEGERGLMDVLTDGVPLADVLCRTDLGTLVVLPAGTRHNRATETLSSEAMRKLLGEMAARYDDRIIIFDSPPLLAASEACVLASSMSQILMVVEAGRTTESAVRDALGRIEGCRAVGMVLNKGNPPGSGLGGYGYGYGYGYGQRL